MANKRYDQFAAGTYSTSKIFLQADAVTGQLEKVFLPARGVWGEITGTLSAQTDLATALAGKEPTITAGTTLQYWRGDKSFQTLNTAAVPESGNLYYTDARARSSISLTTTGTSGAATYNSGTGVLNVPNYAISGSPWLITGNASTVAATNFIGTSDNIAFSLRTNNILRWQWSNTNANASIFPAVTGANQNVLQLFRTGSTSTIAFNLAIDSTDSIFFDTANSPYVFKVSGTTKFTIYTTAAQEAILIGTYDSRIALPAGNTIKNNLSCRDVATNARLALGIDGNSLAAIVLGNTSLRFFNTGSTNDLMLLDTGGNLSIQSVSGPITNTPCGKLTVTSTTSGILFPRMTTTQKNAISSPVNGLVVYDTTLAKLCVYTTAWEVITSI